MVASLWAVAVVALAGPSLPRIRRKNAPRELGLWRRLCAAMRKARLARLWTRRLPVESTLPPRIRFSGQSPNQEAQGLSVGHVLLSRPTSERTMWIVGACHPGTWVRSTPVIRERGERRSNAGSFLWGCLWVVVGGGKGWSAGSTRVANVPRTRSMS